MGFRTERDSLGEVRVPDGALYGAQTQRAVENFPISGRRFGRRFIASLGRIKLACAKANEALGELDSETAGAIRRAATEVIDGAHDDHFPIDVFQTGSGTSTNMNANEVIANRAVQLLGGELGSRAVHPNDHVNRGQSSNDVIPTAMHLAAATAIHEDLLPALTELAGALAARADAFEGAVKSGRTHWMDATPVTLGQEFGGYTRQIDKGIGRARAAREALLELALGGTAVGTGLNRPSRLPELAIAELAQATGLDFREAADHFEAQGAQDAAIEAHGQLNTVAVSLIKIANDIRVLGSGPRTGLAELLLPEVQPGSSIMPGKVNPVIPEMVVLVGARVAGNQTTVTMLAAGGSLELNTGLPILAACLLESIELLANASRTFARRCISGLRADAENARASLERNLALCTALAPAIGYDVAASISKEALASGRTVREVARQRGVLPDEELDRLLDPTSMTGPDPAID